MPNAKESHISHCNLFVKSLIDISFSEAHSHHAVGEDFLSSFFYCVVLSQWSHSNFDLIDDNSLAGDRFSKLILNLLSIKSQ